MRVGFTGTRKGMTEKQKDSFKRLAKQLRVLSFHHGDCIGADAEAHDIITATHPPLCRIYIYPSVFNYLRAYRKGHYIYDPAEPLKRNRQIVDNTDCLIATPHGFEEEQRSGTWATIRYARRCGKKIAIILPDGAVQKE